ncbi:hypothetical protein LCGC14_1070210 [marine sediment metagenome]|uniref:Uncharacterized protein n=1 Tax=marine sediment metagenome TaxID=412755 RepID=A0A0F9N5L8_9ZZZZ
MAKKKTGTGKIIFALILAGAASVGLAYALKKKKFDVEFTNMHEY